MKLPESVATQKCLTLGVSSALMIMIGYPGELLVGLREATNQEPNDQVKALVFRSQWVTVVSWLTYPVVYVFPMLGLTGASTVVAIQCGYCVSDIISKCGVGLIIYSITAAKSEIEAKGALLP